MGVAAYIVVGAASKRPCHYQTVSLSAVEDFVTRLVLIALLLFGAPAQGSNDGLRMVGEARLTYLFWSVYDSRLYSADGTYVAGQLPLRLEIQYLRDVYAADLVRHTQSEWQNLGVAHAGQQDWLDALSRLLPDVSKNDVLAVVVDEEGRSAFLVNGESLGQIDDPGFGEHFLNIWLSPRTSRPELRQALLGLPSP